MVDLQTLDQLVLEIKFYSQQTALNMIEVGKRLLQAKEQVGHGEWGIWLAEKVELSDRTAQYFMKAYETFGNPQSVAVLRPAQVYALLDSPEPVRKEIIENHKPEEMTGKQIKDLSRQLQEAERRAEEAEKKSELIKQQTDNIISKTKTQITIMADLKGENELLRQENKKLANKPIKTVEIVKEVIPTDIKTKLQYQYEQLNQANLKLSQYEGDEQSRFDRAKQDAKLLDQEGQFLASRINSFLADVGKYPFLADALMHSNSASLKSYDTALQRLNKWLNAMQNALPSYTETLEIKEDILS